MVNQATLEIDWPELIKRLIALALPRSDDILGSPPKLGELLNACAELGESERIIQEIASTLAMQKREFPAVRLVHCDGSRCVGSTLHHRTLSALFTTKSAKPDDGSGDATRQC